MTTKELKELDDLITEQTSHLIEDDKGVIVLNSIDFHIGSILVGKFEDAGYEEFEKLVEETRILIKNTEDFVGVLEIFSNKREEIYTSFVRKTDTKEQIYLDIKINLHKFFDKEIEEEIKKALI